MNERARQLREDWEWWVENYLARPSEPNTDRKMRGISHLMATNAELVDDVAGKWVWSKEQKTWVRDR